MMDMIVRIGVIVGFTLLPTILFIVVSVIYHGNFTYINPYELAEVFRILWTGATTVLLVFGISLAIEGGEQQ